MNLNSKSLDIVGAVSSSGKIRKVELDLIPAFIKSHGHCTNKWLHTGSGLIVRCSESSAHIFVVENHYFERKIFTKL